MKHRATVATCALEGMPRTIQIICLGVLIAFLAAAGWAQSIERGSITGTITDPNGDRMPGVNVMLTSTELGATSETMTDANGRYRFVALLPSTYTVEASIEGFSTAQQGDIELTVGKTLSVDLTSIEDVIIVEGSPLIDVRSSTLQTTELNNEILMEVPTGRSIRSVVQLAPGVHSQNADGRQPSAFGSPGMGVQFSVDGVIINSPEAGESEVPLGFFSVEDVTVLGAGASAEYGGYTGVIVNVTTKQGSNDMNGLVDLQLADNDWQSQNTNDPDLQRSGSDRTDTEVHFDLGGPVQRDKAWFFTSFKYYQQDSTASGDHVNAPTNERPRFLGKINWTPTQEKILSGMLEYSTRDQAYQGADEGDFIAPGATVSLEGTQYLFNFNYTDMLSQDTLLDLKFGG
ncbi:MAG: carboxypeptidase regulatory-like domain-containing protein [Acidobacteria bacterium]|nr:carboxypeptidase regulatory-like domain-containing protein [Acidobacteriota bacterium]